MVAGSWVVWASFLSAGGTLALLWYVWGYREKPGAGWFLLSLLGQFVWSVGYGMALLVHEPTIRWALEIVVWTAMAGLIAAFVAFALEYTGRTTIRDRGGLALVAAAPLAMATVTATNPIHGLAWSGFAIDPVAGLATVSYDLETWAVFGTTAGVLMASLASLLLFDTVLSYGRLYRTEAIAVGLSTIPPSVALLVWLYDLGPVPQLNLVTVFFLPHIVLDAYAFVGSDMFEFHPATRRAGERAAIEDLGNPVIIVDERDRIVTLNAAAAGVLQVDKRAVTTQALSTCLQGETIDPTAENQRVTLRYDGAVRTFAVTARPLEDGRDHLVGYTLVLQDVTDDLRREQRLSVLNRVLRHNLRNDMTVIRGFAEAAADAGDEEREAMIDRVVGKADDLVALGEKAREIERVLEREQRPTRFEVESLLAEVTTRADTEGVSTEVSVTPDSLGVTADRETLAVVLGALLDNAIRHGSDEDGTVTLRASEANGEVWITVIDDGPGLPENELAVLDSGEETDLEHGTGLGLWLVTWGAQQLGADLDVTVEDGTRATLRLPADT